MKSLILSAQPVIVLENVSHEIKDVLTSWGYVTKTFFGEDVTGDYSVLANSVALPKEHSLDFSQILPTRHQAQEVVRTISMRR